MNDDATDVETSEAENETAAREALKIAVDHLQDGVKAQAIDRIKQGILVALQKIKTSTPPSCYVDEMWVIASALWYLQNAVDDIDIEDLHPWCDGAAPYLAFASVAVVLELASNLSGAMDTTELWGTDSDSLKIVKKYMVNLEARGQKPS